MKTPLTKKEITNRPKDRERERSVPKKEKKPVLPADQSHKAWDPSALYF